MTTQSDPDFEAKTPFRLTNILVPTDFSAESLKALRYGVAFARQFNAVIWLIHVVPPSPVFAGFEAVPMTLDDQEVQKESERHLTDFASKHVPPGIGVRILAKAGSPFDEVVQNAKDLRIDLIVASTHGHTGWKRVLMGSTAERIVQRAPCPMLVVREQEKEFLGGTNAENSLITKLNRILVPIDFSEPSEKALRYAVAFAQEFRASVHCVHVIEVPYGTGEAAIVIETDEFRGRLREQKERRMTAWLSRQPALVSRECTFKLGTAYREIIQVADDQMSDLIVMGTHGHTGIGHFLIGSTTERVVRHAHCPVLVVREREHEFID